MDCEAGKQNTFQVSERRSRNSLPRQFQLLFQVLTSFFPDFHATCSLFSRNFPSTNVTAGTQRNLNFSTCTLSYFDNAIFLKELLETQKVDHKDRRKKTHKPEQFRPFSTIDFSPPHWTLPEYFIVEYSRSTILLDFPCFVFQNRISLQCFIFQNYLYSLASRKAVSPLFSKSAAQGSGLLRLRDLREN